MESNTKTNLENKLSSDNFPVKDENGLLDLRSFYKDKFKKFITLDFETTGFQHGIDEVLSCSVVNQDGEVLIDTLVKPIFKRIWPEAEKVNHISPEEVFAHGINYNDLIIQLYPIFNAYKNVIIYNATFDAGFLPRDLLSTADFYCAMRLYIAFTQAQNQTEPLERFQKQFRAAEQLGIDYSDLMLHKSKDDAELCRRIWLKIINKSNDLIGNFISPIFNTTLGSHENPY